jgi:hypothetical protein
MAVSQIIATLPKMVGFDEIDYRVLIDNAMSGKRLDERQCVTTTIQQAIRRGSTE